jgi:hypothetical protein
MPNPVSHTWPASSLGSNATSTFSGVDVFMDQTALVEVAERRCHTNRKSQEPRHIECLLPVPIENAVERFAPGSTRTRMVRSSWRVSARGLAAHAGSSSAASEYSCSRLRRTLEQRLFRGRSHDQKGHVVAALSGL